MAAVKRDVRKLLGRLHPVVQQIRDQEASRSSSGDQLSPQDIAAAVGMLPNSQETRIFLSVNWPETVNIPDICAELYEDLFRHWSLLETNHQREFSRRLSAGLRTEVNLPRWRHDPRLYRRIPAVCLVEASSGGVCDLCYGEDEDCPLCEGTGVLPFSQCKRSELLKTSRRTLVRDFVDPYGWVLSRVCRAESAVAITLSRKLA